MFGLDAELGAQDLPLRREVFVGDRLVRFRHPRVTWVAVGAYPLGFLFDPHLSEVVLDLEPALGGDDRLGLAHGPCRHGPGEALRVAQPNPVSRVAQVSALPRVPHIVIYRLEGTIL
jgi:hypothetical protein